MARHQQELDDLQDRMESDKSRQMLALRDRLAKNHRRRMEDLRRKQDAELTSEMLDQRKELDEVRLTQVNNTLVLKLSIKRGLVITTIKLIHIGCNNRHKENELCDQKGVEKKSVPGILPALLVLEVVSL
jgi:hypothetical protein